MILTTLAEADAFGTLAPRIAAGLRWLATATADLPDGRHAIDGDDVFALVSSYSTGPSTEKRFEAHRVYLDLQFVAAGRERILHAHAGDLQVAEAYAESNDITWFADPPQSSSFLMETGSLAVFWPQDAHKPGCMAGGRDEVKKIVVKVRL